MAGISIDLAPLEKAYESYYETARKAPETLPDLRGMSGMDALSILDDLGVQVEVRGNGKVRRQSVSKGTRLKEVKRIVLELS